MIKIERIEIQAILLTDIRAHKIYVETKIDGGIMKKQTMMIVKKLGLMTMKII